MNNYAALPLLFLKFWYIESPIALIKYFLSLNKAFFILFSLPTFVRTFFKPLKNEYRQGLVGFSRGMGMFIKTFLILADLWMLLILLTLEIAVFVGFLAVPIATVWILFL